MAEMAVAVRNAMVDQYAATIGASPTLEIRTGARPSLPSDADAGTLLVTITLPSTWLSAASGGAATKVGTWAGTAAAAGTAGHYRIKNSGTCFDQGSVTATGGGGDLTVDNTSIANTQAVEVTAYSKSIPA